MPIWIVQAGPEREKQGGMEVKKEMIRKRSAVSTAVALFTALVMALVMTLVGTLAVFADDNNMPPLPNHGQSGSQEAGWGNSEYNGQPSVGGGGVSGTGDGDDHELKGWNEGSVPDLSGFGSGEGNMYPGLGGGGIDNNDDNNHEIDDSSADGLNTGTNEDDQLSSGPQPDEGDKKTPDPEKGGLTDTEKDKSEIPKTDKNDPASVPSGSNASASEKKSSLPAVKISKPKASKNAVTVKWKKISKEKRKVVRKVQIQYSTDGKFRKDVKNKLVSAKKTSYRIKGLKTNKKYYVRVRAYTKSGSEVRVSKWSGVKAAVVK